MRRAISGLTFRVNLKARRHTIQMNLTAAGLCYGDLMAAARLKAASATP